MFRLLFLGFVSISGILFSRPYVTVNFNAQLGNQLFLLATAYAYAKDQNYDLLVPKIISQGHCFGIAKNHENIFSSIATRPLPLPPFRIYREPAFSFLRIPRIPNVELRGYFQSEKYFQHRRAEILDLFSLKKEKWEALLNQFSFLTHPLKIGVQIRVYDVAGVDAPHPTFGTPYYEKAFAQFPSEALFLVSSNKKEIAKRILAPINRNIIFLDETNDYQDLLILSRCEHLVSSNSSFGWWAAWLGEQKGRRCIFPMPWFHGELSEAPLRDLIPSRWETIECPEAILQQKDLFS